MTVHMSNPRVVAKIQRLCRAIGVGKTEAAEAALDGMLAEVEGKRWGGLEAIIAQMRRISPRPDAYDAVVYNKMGIPK